MENKFTLTSPQKVTIVESIIEQIVQQIRDGHLKPGDRLPSARQLIDMLGVSRSSVREALQGLSAMGLIEIRPGEGTIVREIRPDFILIQDIGKYSSDLQKETRQYLIQARYVFEQGIIALAIENLNAKSVNLIQNALKKYEESDQNDFENFNWTMHDELHLAIAQATGNPFLVQILNNLLGILPKSMLDKEWLRMSADMYKVASEQERNTHLELAKAILNRDLPTAQQCLQKHYEQQKLAIH